MLLSKNSHIFEVEKVLERTYSSLDQISEYVKEENILNSYINHNKYIHILIYIRKH